MSSVLIRLTFIVMIGVIFLGCEDQSKIKASGKTIEIGVIVPLSGARKMLGVKALIGLNAAYALKPLSPAGDKIVLHIEDNNSSIEESKALLQTFAQNKEIKAIFILLESNVALAILPTINQLKIPVIATMATHESLTKKSHYITRVSSSNDAQGKIAAFFVHDELMIKKSALFYDIDSVYSTSLALYFEEEFKNIGGKVLGQLTSDMSKFVLQKSLIDLKKRGVEIIYASAISEKLLALLQINRDLNLDFKILGTGNMLANMSERGITNYVELSHNTFVVAEYFDDRIASKIEQQIQRYSHDNGVELNTHSLLAYEGYLLLNDTLGKCTTCGRMSLNNALRNHHGFEGINDTIRIKEGDVKRPMFINSIRNEKMYLYVKVF